MEGDLKNNHLTGRLKEKVIKIPFSVTYPSVDTCLATFYLRQLLFCSPHTRRVFIHLGLTWSWTAKRSQLDITLASAVNILFCFNCLLIYF